MLRAISFLAYGVLTYSLLTTVSDCGKSAAVFTVNSVETVPLNPVPGQNMTLMLDYTVPAGTTVTGGQAEYDITWNYIPFEPSYEPLCHNIPCPLGPGRYTNQSTSVWPDSVSGYITSQMKWLDEGNKLLLCVEVANQLASTLSDTQNKQLVPYSYYRRYLRGGAPQA